MRIVLCTRNAAAEIEARLRSLAGEDVVVIDKPQDLPAALKTADALFCPDFYYSQEVAQILGTAGSPLRWVQLLTAGYDNVLRFGAPANVTVTNAGNAFAASVALHGLTMLLALCRQMPATFANQQKHGWNRDFMPRLLTPEGMTIALLGVGNIGQEIARLLAPWDAHLIGVSRTARRVAHVNETASLEDLPSVLARSDAVIIALPLDTATNSLFDSQRLAQCKRSCLLVNIARGSIVDNVALSDALANGVIGGAALDVTEPEPLPPNHPLWHAPNIIISPHVAGSSGAASARRLAEMAAANLRNFIDGHPLQNAIKAPHAT